MTLNKWTGRRQGSEAGIPDLPTPPDERWSATVAPGPDAWELVVIGPERGRESQLGWQIDRPANGVRYRRLLRSKADRQPEAIRRALRSLIWHRIRFQPNPIASIDPPLADALEHTVWDALRRHRRLGPVQVRFNMWQEEGEGRRFVCKVESLPNGSAEAGRRWWSPIVRDPEELAAALAVAYPPDGLGSEPPEGLLAPPGKPVRTSSLTAPSGV